MSVRDKAQKIPAAGFEAGTSATEFGCPEPHPDTDVSALAEGYITVTPLQFDLTQAARLRQMEGWQWRL